MSPLLSITIDLGDPQPQPQPGVRRWRALYPWEGGNDVPDGMPAVLPALRWHAGGYIKYIPPIEFNKQLQFLSWFLMSRLNPSITQRQWAAVWAGDRWGTNGNGWDNSAEPDDQRRDYVNDRYQGYPDPKLMDAIIFSGSIYGGDEDEHHVILRPGVHGVDVTRALPSVDEVIARGWYMLAVNNTRPGSPFPQGNGGPVAVPIFLREPAMYRKDWFVPVW